MPEEPFPNPLTWTWSHDQGRGPVRGCRSGSRSRSAWRTRGRCTARATTSTTSSCRARRCRSRSTRGTARRRPTADVLDLIGRAGTDIAPHERCHRAVRRESPPGTDVRQCGRAAGRRRWSGRSSSRSRATRRSRSRQRAACGSPGTTAREPSVDAPSRSSSAPGTLYNRDGREYLVKAFPMTSASTRDRVHLACYFPMPFFQSRADRAGRRRGEAVDDVRVDSRGGAVPRPAEPRRLLPRDLSRPPRSPSRARTWSCSTRRETEGGGDWSGSFVGTSFIFSHNAEPEHARGRPALLLRRQPDAAGPGHRHRGVGRRRRLLGRAEHDAAASPATPSARRSAKDGEGRRGQDRVGVPLPARRPDAVRAERAYPAGARRRRTIRRSTTRP